MSSGLPTWDNWDWHTTLVDQRRTDDKIGIFQPDYSGFRVYQKEATDQGSTELKSAAAFTMLHIGAGHSATVSSTGANKPSYYGLDTSLYSNRYGQEYAINSQLFKTGSGEAMSIYGQVVCSGNSWTTGDEGCKGAKITAQQTPNGPEFAATITSVVDNGSTLTLTYNNATGNGNVPRGDGRYIIRTAGQYTTGTASVNNAAPPVVTFSGSTLTSAFGATGARTDLCFSLNADDKTVSGNTYSYWIPVKSLDSDTQVTLNPYVGGGTAISWKGTSGAGQSYRIAYCAQITDLDQGSPSNTTGTLTVSKGTTTWVANDTFTQALGYNNPMIGLQVSTVQTTPLAGNPTSAGIMYTNTGQAPMIFGFYSSGLIGSAIQQFDNTFPAIRFTSKTKDSANGP